MDRLHSMSVFVKAADMGSFASAGAAMGMSSQMTGKHVSALEERIGAKLLNRTTRRQSLTEVGQQFYQRCKVVLAEVEAAEAVAQNLVATPRGLLRISAPVTFGTYSLMPVISRYLKAHPEVQIDLSLSDRLVDLIDESYEAVIRIGELSDSSLVARSLKPYRLIAAAAPDYLARHGTPLVPDELTEHECLGFKFLMRPQTKEWPFIEGDRLQAVAVNTRLQVNDARAQLAAARDGLGIILGAEVMLHDEITSGRLVRLFADYPTPTRPVHLLFLGDRHLPPKLRSFIDQVVAELGTEAQA